MVCPKIMKTKERSKPQCDPPVHGFRKAPDSADENRRPDGLDLLQSKTAPYVFAETGGA